MALAGEVLEPRFQNWLRRLVGHKGPLRLQAVPELQPIIPAVQPEQFEQYWPLGLILAAASGRLTAGAGQFAQSGILNPKGSGHVCALVDWDIEGSTGIPELYLKKNLAAANFTPQASLGVAGLDSRSVFEGDTTPIRDVSAQNAANRVIFGGVTFTGPRYQGVIKVRLPIVLMPDSAFMFTTPQTADTFRYNYVLLIRALSPEETL
jgi:hypothetical protein